MNLAGILEWVLGNSKRNLNSFDGIKLTLYL